jgi:thiol reductant ABC exporter CydC subunit
MAETVRRVVRIGEAPLRRLVVSTGFGTAAALSTVGLLACAGALIDKAALRPPLYTLTVLMAAVQMLALCRGPLRYGERIVSHDTALRILGRLRLWVYDEVEPRSPAGLRHVRGGDLLARATVDIETLQDLYLRGVPPLLVAAVTSASATILLTVILPSAGLVLAMGLGGALGSTSILAWLRHRRLGASELALRGELASDIVELFGGAPDLEAFGLVDHYLDRVLGIDESLTRMARRRSWTAGAIAATSACFLGATVVGLLAVAIVAVDNHQLSGFMLAVLPLVALGAFEVVAPAADAFSRLPEYFGAANRLLQVADLPVPVSDPIAPMPTPRSTDIRLDDVRLRYGVDSPWALDGLTLSVGTGRRIALVGASGSGKSSVANVLLRFWPISNGTATIGGASIDRMDQGTTHTLISWAAQDTHLFNTTIRANIALARSDASDAEVREASRAAQLGPWIDSLPNGLDTQVGENGTQLSGGQRQRIALARVLLANSPVLILDEPTSGLDEHMASRLLEDVLVATTGKTMIYITHRLSELAGFDGAVAIENGQIDLAFHRPE